MEKHLFCAPAVFGLEGVVRDELKHLGMESVSAADGRVIFGGTLADAAKALVNLRCAERVQVVAAEFEAHTFDELFEGARAVEWERYIPRGCAFPVRGSCVDSQLMSANDCVSILRKAVATRLGSRYGVERLDESGDVRQIRFTILKDRALLHVDLAGEPLHKRGYRPHALAAPLRETLAAAMVILMRYRGRDAFRDPMCGSGTIPIEAALIAKNRAPGLLRHFSLEKWEGGAELIRLAKEEARSREYDKVYDILGSDIDPEAVDLARANAKAAGVADCVRINHTDARNFVPPADRCCVILNPPYGVRLGDGIEAGDLMKAFGRAMSKAQSCDLGVLSADPELEAWLGLGSAKRRRVYNGMLRCDFHMYFSDARNKRNNKA